MSEEGLYRSKGMEGLSPLKNDILTMNFRNSQQPHS